MIITQLEVALKLIRLRSLKYGIYVSRLVDNDCEFQTSDNSVCCTNINSKFIIPADPTNILSLPLDNKHKLFLMPYSDDSTKNIITRHNVSGTFCFTEKLTSNHQQAKNAERFVLGNESVLKDYLNDKEKYDKPPTKEQEEKFNKLNELINKFEPLGL